MRRSTFIKVRNIATTALGICVFTGAVLMAGYADTTAMADTRVESARFYTNDGGTVVTADGHEWVYSTDVLDDAFQDSTGKVYFNGIEHEAKNDVPVWVRIGDNGTPDYLKDDEVLKVGLDFCAYMDEQIDANEIAIRHNWEFIEKTDEFIKAHNYK